MTELKTQKNQLLFSRSLALGAATAKEQKQTKAF